MKLLENRILKDGRIINGDVIKVDSFLNHQLDIELLDKMAEEIKTHFSNKKINKILTIEASGIAIATVLALKYSNVKVVFAKKKKTLNIGDSFTSNVSSFTTKKDYIVTVSKEFLNEDDNILIIDDFLAEGNALKGLIDISNQAKANIEGICVAVEKGYLNGAKSIRNMGYELLSLAVIDSIENGKFHFK